GLDVVVIPTNKPIKRQDHPDVIYKTEREKFNAIADDIARASSKGQPILVGTISIEKSELLSQLLKKRGITHNVLNAKYHEREAQIVAEAGQPGMVTIATNMAGRGTDIVLGGRKLYIDELEEHIPAHTPELWDSFKNAVLRSDFHKAEGFIEKLEGKDRSKAQAVVKSGREWEKHNQTVLTAGGLYILGTERHEARRIDNQLRGRSGRQGDPGESRFYLSLDDNLMRIFGSERIYSIMDRLGMEEGQQIESKMVSNAIAGAQKRVEGRNYEIRKHLLEYDDVMNTQREFVYQKRNEILTGEDISQTISDYFYDAIEDAIELYSNGKNHPDEWDVEALNSYLDTKFMADLSIPRQEMKNMKYDDIVSALHDRMMAEYHKKEESLGTENMRHLERMISLQVIDTKWREHLYQMDELREGIWTVGYGQKQPLVEYKLQGFEIFQQMIAQLKTDIAEFILKVKVNRVEMPEEAPVEYRQIGNEHHDEVEQFGTGGIPTSPHGSAYNPNRERKKTAPVEGATKRKKSRRSRRR
ncbi:MAG: preprotein translocase subunit SecA, partial [Spirochaetota bacterium]